MIKEINISNNKIPYIDFGSGSIPFVIIPGLGARSTLVFEDGIINQYSSILDKYHFYLIERPCNIKKVITIEEIALCYYEAMKALNIEKPVVFGNSMGAMIAMMIALHDKKYIDKLIISSSCARVDEYSRCLFEKWKDMSYGDINAFNMEMARDIYSMATIDKYKDALITPYKDLTELELERFRYQCDALLSFDIYDRIKDIDSCMYFIGSKCDNVFKYERYEELLPFVCNYHIYDNFSHMVCDEDPKFLENMLQMIK